MKRVTQLLMVGFLAFWSIAAHAEYPGNHPAYLHALADLRAARWLLAHRQGDWAVSVHEANAIGRVDRAIAEIRQAAIDDGKDIHDHVGVDDTGDYRGRLHRAADLLGRVRGDLNREEDNGYANGLKHRALHHVDEALNETRGAIWDVEHHR